MAYKTDELVNDTTPQLGGDLDCNSHGINMADQVLSRPKLIDYGETYNAISGTQTGNFNIDMENGNVQATTFGSGTYSVTITNPPAAGTAGSLTLIATNAGLGTITWTNVDWAGGTAPTLTASGVDILTFMTVDGGTTWYGFAAGLAMA